MSASRYDVLVSTCLLALLSRITASEDCFFVDLVSKCRTTVKQYNVTITSTINRCHQPIDITVELQNDQPYFTWRHTFANDGETQLIANYTEETFMHFKIDRFFWKEKPELRIAAWVIVQKEGVTRFLKTKTMVNTEDCNGGSSSPVAAVLAGVFVTITVLSLTVAIVFVCYKRHKHSKRRDQLILNMEAPAVAEPFADTGGPSSISRRSHQDSKADRKVPAGSGTKDKEITQTTENIDANIALTSSTLQTRDFEDGVHSKGQHSAGNNIPLDLEGAVGYSLNPTNSGKTPYSPFGGSGGGASHKHKNRNKQSHRRVERGVISSSGHLVNGDHVDNRDIEKLGRNVRGSGGRRKKGGQRFSDTTKRGVDVHKDGGEKFAEELSVRLSSLQHDLSSSSKMSKDRQTNGYFTGQEVPEDLGDSLSIKDDHTFVASLHRDSAGIPILENPKKIEVRNNCALPDMEPSNNPYSFVDSGGMGISDNPNGFGGAKPKRKLPQMQPVI